MLVELLYAEFGDRDFRTAWIPEVLMQRLVKSLAIDPGLPRHVKNQKVGIMLRSLEGEQCTVKSGAQVILKIKRPDNRFAPRFFRLEAL